MRRQPTAAFSYYGGKQRIASQIVPFLPPHSVYVETHAGGLAVLFAKGKHRTGNHGDYREVINDTDGRAINFYRVMQDPELCQELQRRLTWTLYSRAEHQRSTALLRSGEGTPIDQAWAWYVNIQQSFSNKLFGGWSTNVVGRNQAHTWWRHTTQLPAVHQRLRAVHVEQLDQCEIITKWDSPQTCFYCDPPYVGADQGHYAGYTQAHFELLLEALDQCQGSFVLSCYDNPALEQYDFERHEINAVVTSSGTGTTGKNRDKTRAATEEEQGDRKRIELVLFKDRSQAARRESQEAFRRLTQGVLFQE